MLELSFGLSQVPWKCLNIITLGERVDILCLRSEHQSGFTIDDETTGPWAMAMWLYGIFVRTCVFAKLVKNCASFQVHFHWQGAQRMA